MGLLCIWHCFRVIHMRKITFDYFQGPIFFQNLFIYFILRSHSSSATLRCIHPSYHISQVHFSQTPRYFASSYWIISIIWRQKRMRKHNCEMRRKSFHGNPCLDQSEYNQTRLSAPKPGTSPTLNLCLLPKSLQYWPHYHFLVFVVWRFFVWIREKCKK